MIGHCEVCDREGREILGVAAVPGAAVSVATCRECIVRDCQPLFCVEVAVCLGKGVGIPQWFGLHDYLSIYRRI